MTQTNEARSGRNTGLPSALPNGEDDLAIGILLEVAESMMAANGEQAALNRLANLALEATSADRCAILVRDPRGYPRLLPAAAASRVGNPADQWIRFRSMEPIDVDVHPERLALWGAERTITISDVNSSSIMPEAWKKTWRSKSLAFSSLRAGGEIYGLLALDYVTAPHEFSARETRLVDAIACAAGVALRNTRLVEKLERAVEVERRLAECSAAVQSGGSLSEVLDIVVDRFTSLLPGTSCSINLIGDDKNSFSIAAFRGRPPAAETIRLDERPQDDINTFRQLWDTDPTQPVVISDVRKFPGWTDVVPPEIGPGMLVPLWDGKAVLGFIAAGRPQHQFTPEEVTVAVAFASQAAIAVSKARLTEALKMRLSVIEIFQKLNSVVSHTTDLRHVLPAVNKAVGEEVDVECLRMVFADEAVGAIVGTRRPDATERRLLRQWRASPVAASETIGDEVAVPIVMRGRPSGVLWIRHLRDTEPVSFDFLEAIAGCLGEIASKAQLRRTAELRSRELAVAAERERIARDLHDTVGQTFFGIGLKLQDLIAEIEDPTLLQRLSELRALAARSVADVRSAVYALSFLHVRAEGLVPSLRALVRQFTATTAIHAELRIAGTIPALTDDVESALFRIAHEALINVDRHARATGVIVTLTPKEDTVEMVIRDDGVGLDQRQVADWRSAAHFGMRAMAKAAHDVSGDFRVAAASPRGLAIRASVPCRVNRKRSGRAG